MNKFLIMLMTGVFLSFGSMFPQVGLSDMHEGHGDVNEMINKKMEKMDKKLKLTQEQKDQMRAAMKEKMDKKHQIMEANQKAMEAVRAEHQAKMKTILSEEQMKKMEKMQGDMKEGCPMCKDGKMCPKCMLKSKEMKKDCPMCKDGKMCEKCKLHKAKDMKKHKDGDHKH